MILYIVKYFTTSKDFIIAIYHRNFKTYCDRYQIVERETIHSISGVKEDFTEITVVDFNIAFFFSFLLFVYCHFIYLFSKDQIATFLSLLKGWLRRGLNCILFLCFETMYLCRKYNYDTSLLIFGVLPFDIR